MIYRQAAQTEEEEEEDARRRTTDPLIVILHDEDYYYYDGGGGEGGGRTTEEEEEEEEDTGPQWMPEDNGSREEEGGGTADQSIATSADRRDHDRAEEEEEEEQRSDHIAVLFDETCTASEILENLTRHVTGYTSCRIMDLARLQAQAQATQELRLCAVITWRSQLRPRYLEDLVSIFTASDITGEDDFDNDVWMPYHWTDRLCGLDRILIFCSRGSRLPDDVARYTRHTTSSKTKTTVFSREICGESGGKRPRARPVCRGGGDDIGMESS